MIKVDSLQGKYVLAVYGGVDSMVLLDVLSKQAGLELVIAHFDHGIRNDSDVDAKFVQKKALNYQLPFYLERGKLGLSASENAARQARYKFLNSIKMQTGSSAIITAHHQDDLIETAIINILRGSGPAGLVAMLNNAQIIRPFLKIRKSEILNYAKKYKIDWVEDRTNSDTIYLRNYIRKHVMTKLSDSQNKEVLKNIYKIQKISDDINELNQQLAKIVLLNQTTLKRAAFIDLPADVGAEFIYGWLKKSKILDLDRKVIERLVLAIKTAKPAAAVDIKKGAKLEFTLKNAQIRTP